MEITTEDASHTHDNGPGSSSSAAAAATPEVLDRDDLVGELESLRQSYWNLQSHSAALEERLLLSQRQRDELLHQNTDLAKAVDEISRESESLGDQIHELGLTFKQKEEDFARKVDEEFSRAEELKKEVENLEKEAKANTEFLLRSFDSIQSAKESLVKLIECLDDEKVVETVEEESVELELDKASSRVWEEIVVVKRLASKAELKVSEYKELRKKEKRELENSLVSLTEENRDINSLLRIALVEKEAVEKSLSKLKGNSEQKRVALLQIAERGLQRVGFGFMMGSGSNEQSLETSTAASSKSDSSECEEEVVSLASTMERIMKNLRQELTQLRKSLEESRSDTERLQSLTEKQDHKIAENSLYIKELEHRENMLTQNVEELLTEIQETEAEVARWREACELEVEAGKNEIEEREKVVSILKQELDKTKAALGMSNGKLRLKEDLAAAAMAAQAAAEKSLQLADSRVAGLHDRIEDLTRQLEEAERREGSSRKLRHICWPWRAFRMSPASNANTRVQNVRRMLPEMQALLRYTV